MNQLHPLGKLIQDAQNTYGWSTRDLEREAERHGHSMKHSNFSRLKLEPVVAIKATQIEILAKVLRHSQQAVATAAIKSMGVDLDTPSGRLEDAIRSSPEISTRDRQILLSVVNVMRDNESGTNGHPASGPLESSTPPRRRAVAPASDPRPGQKTGPDESILEFHGADAEKYPAPPIEQLAAHPQFETEHEKFERLHGQRGEENQEVED